MTDSSGNEAGTILARSLFILACVTTLGAGLLTSNALPLIIGTLVEHLKWTQSEAGAAGTLEMGAVAVTAGFLSLRVHRFTKSKLAVFGGALIVLANLLSSVSVIPEVILLARLVAGIGAGCALAAANAAIAGERDPDQIFAIVTFLGGMAAAALLVGLSWVVAAGFATMMLVLAGVAGASIPPMVFLKGGVSHHRPQGAPADPVRWNLAFPVLASLLLLSIGEGAIWAYSERIGNRLGMASTEIGTVLAGATLIGLLGALLAAWLGLRFGRFRPLFIGLCIEGIGCLIIGAASHEYAYIAGQLIYSSSYLFTIPYLMGAAAAVDPLGRVATAASSVLLFATALGPTVGGVVADHAGYTVLGLLVCALAVSAAFLIMPTLRFLQLPSELTRGAT